MGGTLTNSRSLAIGNTTLSASDKVTAASLDNTGSIYLYGSGANQALLDVTTGSAGFGTAGVLSGYVHLSGDSAIEFASGEITSLADCAYLHLIGSDAFIEDSTALGSNSALTGLAASVSRGRLSISKTAPRCRRPARWTNHRIDFSRRQWDPGAPRRRRQRGIRHGGRPERQCATGRRQRDRVRER